MEYKVKGDTKFLHKFDWVRENSIQTLHPPEWVLCAVGLFVLQYIFMFMENLVVFIQQPISALNFCVFPPPLSSTYFINLMTSNQAILAILTTQFFFMKSFNKFSSSGKQDTPASVCSKIASASPS